MPWGKERQREIRAERKANGLCTDCAKPRGESTSVILCHECLAKQRITSRVGYWKHRDKRLKWAREYKRNNLEHVRKNKREAAKRRYYENIEKRRKYARDRYWQNLEKIKKYARELRRKLYKENPAQFKAWAFKHKANKMSAQGYATPEQIQARIDYYGRLCYMCGKEANGIDHLIPLSVGGTNWPANLRPACRSCNSKKGNKSPWDFI